MIFTPKNVLLTCLLFGCLLYYVYYVCMMWANNDIFTPKNALTVLAVHHSLNYLSLMLIHSNDNGGNRWWVNMIAHMCGPFACPLFAICGASWCDINGWTFGDYSQWRRMFSK